MKLQTSYLALLLAAVGVSGGCSVYDKSLLDGPSNGGGAGNSGGDGGGSARDGGGGGNTGGGSSGGTSGGGGGTGATSSGGAGGDAGEVTACLPNATYPRQPSADEVPDGGSIQAFDVVMYDIDLGDRDVALGEALPEEYRTVGLNIDDECTTPQDETAGECVPPEWADRQFDGPGGIDNSIGAIIQGVRAIVGDFSSENYTEQLQAGTTNVALRVSDWNGQPNDRQVQVTVYVAHAFSAFKQGCEDDPDAGACRPAWDGDDVWPIASDSLVQDPQTKQFSLDRPKYFDPRAWVANNRLVASLAQNTLRLDIELGLGDVSLNLNLKGSALVCDIEETGDVGYGYQLSNCVLAGRWETDDLVHQLSAFPNPNDLINLLPLCYDPNPNGNYQRFKEQICSFTDTATERAPVTAPCNGLSFGVRFNTRPALLGDIYKLADPVDRCAPEVDPKFDSCDPAKVTFGADAGADGSTAQPEAGAPDAGGPGTDAGSPPPADASASD